MLEFYTNNRDIPSIPITVIHRDKLVSWLRDQNELCQAWVKSNYFNAASGTYCCIPNQEGKLTQVLVGYEADSEYWQLGALASQLPQGVYAFDGSVDEKTLYLASLAWGCHSYQFDKYKKHDKSFNQLRLSTTFNQEQLNQTVAAIFLARDLINTPTEDMGPEQLSLVAKSLAKLYKASFSVIEGDKLLKYNYPAIHAVGRASQQAPRLIDINWGKKNLPKVTLVGKGVCFDSGGLDIKPAAGMRLMKKDMGGAAHTLALAQMIMAAELPICLRVLIPAVENAVSANAYRPGDVIPSRKGLTIEIGNTDAEGRVILADALCEASSDEPELIIDFATLTGAARIAMGADLPAMFCNNDEVAAGILSAADQVMDPLWRMPLYKPYDKLIDSPIADVSNTASQHYGGAITAALFLQRFIDKPIPWVHFDIMAWNTNSRPGRPEGGEAVGLRAVFRYLTERY